MRRIVLSPWAPRLTRRGWVFVVLGAALMLIALGIDQKNLFFVACLLVVAPLVALGYVAIRPGEVAVTRSFRPPIVPAGSETLVVLELRNLSRRPLDGASWRDSSGIEAQTAGPGDLGLPALDRRRSGPPTGPDSLRLEYTATPRRRGVFSFGPLVIGRKDPFGLALREHPIGQRHDLVVTPRVTSLRTRGDAATRDDGSVRDLLRSLNPMSDELIAREYRPGDPLRRVNWPATARHGEIMVRQEEQRSNPEARIVLATTVPGGTAPFGASSGRVRHSNAAFELAIELVASIGVHLLDAGLKVQLVETGPSQLVPGSTQNRGGLRGDAPLVCRAPGGERELLEGLANLEPVGPATDQDSRTGEPGSHDSGGGGRIPTFAVLWSASEADAAELAGTRGRCEPAIAFVLDPVGVAARSVLRESGWLCVPLRSSQEIPDAWAHARARRGGGADDA